MGALVKYDPRPLLTRAHDFWPEWVWQKREALEPNLAAEGAQLTLGMLERYNRKPSLFAIRQHALLVYGLVAMGLELEANGEVTKAYYLLRARPMTYFFRRAYTALGKLAKLADVMRGYVDGDELNEYCISRIEFDIECRNPDLHRYKIAQFAAILPSHLTHGGWDATMVYHEAKKCLESLALMAMARKALFAHYGRKIEQSEEPAKVAATLILSLALDRAQPESPIPQKQFIMLLRGISCHAHRFEGWYEDHLRPKVQDLQQQLPSESQTAFRFFVTDVVRKFAEAWEKEVLSQQLNLFLLQLDLDCMLPGFGLEPEAQARKIARIIKVR